VSRVLRAQNLTKRFGDDKVVDNVSLESPEGKITVIMGPNGAGKTTLLKMLALLIPPDAGEIEYNGVKVNTLGEKEKPEFQRKISFVPQKPPVLTASVFRNVYLPLRFRGVEPSRAKSLAEEWLARFRLAGFSRKNAQNLSGGEKQLLALARAFATQPEILLLDEPTAHLAPQNAEFVREFIKRFVYETKAHAIIVSHSVTEAKTLADRLLVMVSGKIKAVYDGEFREEEILKWI
jgi:tungstate transport system ATP-binding protein